MKTLAEQIEKIESEGKKKDLNFFLNGIASILIGIIIYVIVEHSSYVNFLIQLFSK